MWSILPYVGHTELGRPRVVGVAPVPTYLEVADSDPYPKVWKNSLRQPCGRQYIMIWTDQNIRGGESMSNKLFTVCVSASFSQGPNSGTEQK